MSRNLGVSSHALFPCSLWSGSITSRSSSGSVDMHKEAHFPIHTSFDSRRFASTWVWRTMDLTQRCKRITAMSSGRSKLASTRQSRRNQGGGELIEYENGEENEVDQNLHFNVTIWCDSRCKVIPCSFDSRFDSRWPDKFLEIFLGPWNMFDVWKVWQCQYLCGKGSTLVTKVCPSLHLASSSFRRYRRNGCPSFDCLWSNDADVEEFRLLSLRC